MNTCVYVELVSCIFNKMADSSSEDNNSKKFAIGIDLGTTFSCAAIYENSRAKAISNEYSQYITASCVAFTKLQRQIGESARISMASNGKNTIFDAKRFIGCTYAEIQTNDPQLLSSWPFDVVNVNGKPKFKVIFRDEEFLFDPIEISAMVLIKMKQLIVTYLQRDFTDVVITVPANFTNTQRHATNHAAKLAGLNVIRMINEPTAAALAYEHQITNIKKSQTEQFVLVFDLGK